MLRLVRFVLCLLIVSTLPAYAQFGGPLPERNFQPIQQIFLNLPLATASVLEPGRLRVHIETAESNEIATEQGHTQALLKFEQNRTVLGGAFGIAPGWEVGLDLPFISRYGGFLDPIVDSVEDLFGANNPERRAFPNNSFGGFHVRSDHTTLFEGRRQYLELGDLWISSKVQLWQPQPKTTISLRAAIKLPTGRAGGVFGSGKPDFGFGLAAQHQLLRWLMLYGNLAYVYPVGPVTRARLTLNPIISEGVAFEAYVGRGISLLLQQAFYTSPFHGLGTPVLDGDVVELSAGLNWRYGPLLTQLGGIDNVSGVAQAADFTLLLRIVYES
ncbi:MAG: DUF3187 family protein [Deltaproteobacteria bacterium]|nr:DUF3187 family protein [Deltaproteobacteria bacterium]